MKAGWKHYVALSSTIYHLVIDSALICIMLKCLAHLCPLCKLAAVQIQTYCMCKVNTNLAHKSCSEAKFLQLWKSILQVICIMSKYIANLMFISATAQIYTQIFAASKFCANLVTKFAIYFHSTQMYRKFSINICDDGNLTQMCCKFLFVQIRKCNQCKVMQIY